MKRIIPFLLALMLMLCLPMTAYADVIWIPEDPFLNIHMDECIRTDRAYRALTDTKVYESPEVDKVLWTLAEGETAWIYYIYTDANGNNWGCFEHSKDHTAGWIPLAYAELVYDYISFAEDYGHLFQHLDKTGKLPEEFSDDVVIFWAYPGSESGYAFDMMQWSGDYLPEYDRVYQDTQGRTWGYVGYYYGYRHFWICLNDPTADFDTLYPNGAPEVERTEPTIPTDPIVPEGSSSLKIGITIAIVALIAVTGALLYCQKKKGSSKS